MRAVLVIGSIVLVLYIGACAALFVNQRSMIYFPQPAGSVGSTISLPVPGAILKVAVREHAGPKAIIYFGGNAEDVVGNLPEFSNRFPHHAIYLLNYRGYGGSTGKPTEADLHADAQVLYALVAGTHADVTVIGRSLGSGVAVQLAARVPVARLVLVTPYDSIAAIAARQFPLFPVRWLLTDKFESARYAPNLKLPTLILRAERDEVIPRDSTERLAASFAQGVATTVVIEGAGHNTIGSAPHYWTALHTALGE